MLGIGGNVDQLEQSLVVLIRLRLFLGEVEQLGVVDFSDTSGSPDQVLVATDEDLMGPNLALMAYRPSTWMAA